jgi:hypothetical protein
MLFPQYYYGFIRLIAGDVKGSAHYSIHRSAGEVLLAQREEVGLGLVGMPLSSPVGR